MEKLFTTKEVAEMLKVEPITVRRWIIKGDLSAIALGSINKEYRIKESALNEFISKRETK